eukprot:scaffold85418_cov63-Phaeocystis_antarctica.AAC.3
MALAARSLSAWAIKGFCMSSALRRDVVQQPVRCELVLALLGADALFVEHVELLGALVELDHVFELEADARREVLPDALHLLPQPDVLVLRALAVVALVLLSHQADGLLEHRLGTHRARVGVLGEPQILLRYLLAGALHGVVEHDVAALAHRLRRRLLPPLVEARRERGAACLEAARPLLPLRALHGVLVLGLEGIRTAEG